MGDPSVATSFSIPVPASPRTGIALWTADQATGWYALPARRPRGLVVFAHGHGNTPAGAWLSHLTQVAQQDAVIAVAMDYYADQQDPAMTPPLDPTFGWRVAEGADYSIAAARAFDAACPRLKTIVMYGISMGGNTAGLAVAARAHRVRHPHRPLFDYLFDVEGVVNLTEQYFEANIADKAIAPQKAVREIEEETGGPLGPATASAYLSRTVVARIADIAASGIRGVVLAHSVDDGLVPYNQTREFAAELAAEHVPVDLFSVGTRNGPEQKPPDDDTTLDSYVTSHIPGFQSPLNGHGWEGSPGSDPNIPMNVVIKTGFDRLAALFNLDQRPGCYREFVVNGQSDGSIQTTPRPTSVPTTNCA